MGMSNEARTETEHKITSVGYEGKTQEEPEEVPTDLEWHDTFLGIHAQLKRIADAIESANKPKLSGPMGRG